MHEWYPEPASARSDPVNAYCDELFATLARSDQRRWATVYLRGLLGLAGRKSLRRISEHVLGHSAVQSLQQFVNQSPWEDDGVRQSLARLVSARMAPRAWAVEEVVFPKHGRYSAGVARQFVPSTGRVESCQLGLSVSLTDGTASVPVDWRLVLPRQWDDDASLRAGAHLPAEQRHRSKVQLTLDTLDGLVTDWRLRPAPVLLDARYERDLPALIRGLEERGLGYLVEVGEDSQLPVAARFRPAAPSALPHSAHRGVLVGAGFAGTSAPPRPTAPAGMRELIRQSAGGPADAVPLHRLTVAEAVRGAGTETGRATMAWREGIEGRLQSSQFLVVQLPAAHDPARRLSSAPRRLIMQWPAGRPRPRACWLTNLSGRVLPELIGLAKMRWRPQYDLNRMREEFGLTDFEGRSFRGWHHHVTLVSAAYGFHCLERLEARRAAGEPYLPAA